MNARIRALSPRVALRVFYFVLLASLGVYLPFFPAWLRAQGFSGLQMSLVIALMPAMGVLAPPFIGYVADLFGLRGTLLRWLSLAAWLCFTALAVHSVTQQSTQQPALFTVVFGCILLFALFRSPIGMLADVIAIEEGSNYGRIRLWGSLGFMVSAVVAGSWITAPGSSSVPVATAALLGLVVVTSFVLPAHAHMPPGPIREEAKQLVKRRSFQFFLVSAFFGQASHSAYDLCSGLLFEDLGGSALVGAGWGIGVAAEITLLAYSAVFLARHSALRLRTFALAITVLRWLLMAQISSVAVLLVLQLLHAITFAMMWFSSIALVKDLSTPRTLGTAQGLFVAASAVGGVLGMLIWGPLYRSGGAEPVFVCAALAALISCLINAFTPIGSPHSNTGGIKGDS
jgi:PPP family 3-phenylpropionic acid transporter